MPEQFIPGFFFPPSFKTHILTFKKKKKKIGWGIFPRLSGNMGNNGCICWLGIPHLLKSVNQWMLPACGTPTVWIWGRVGLAVFFCVFSTYITSTLALFQWKCIPLLHKSINLVTFFNSILCVISISQNECVLNELHKLNLVFLFLLYICTGCVIARVCVKYFFT